MSTSNLGPNIAGLKKANLVLLKSYSYKMRKLSSKTSNRIYYGEQTRKALGNFPFSNGTTRIELIYAIAQIKKASAKANYVSGKLDKDRYLLISKACDELTNGQFDGQFVTSTLQGGAGTSINMNVNEVVAKRAEELCHKSLKIHPNDHVNLSQSTNDVNPSALRISSLQLLKNLTDSLESLASALITKANKHKKTVKLARTHLQDAVPITIGDEFASYSAILLRDVRRLQRVSKYLLELNLGGTAVGNSLNTSDRYVTNLYKELRVITGLPLRKSANFMSLTSSSSDFCELISLITIACMDLSKIATDIRILSSGPRGGIGEISLEELQAGSSIMPGKVNPILPESVNQLFYTVMGKCITSFQAAEAANLELSVMFPVIAESIISSLKLATSVINAFNKKCVALLTVNEDRCKELLENSTAYATILTPILGYDLVSRVVKEAIADNKDIRSVILEKGLLSPTELSKYIKL